MCKPSDLINIQHPSQGADPWLSSLSKGQRIMASVFKPQGKKEFVVVYTDHDGRRRKKRAFADKRESERLARHLEEKARKAKEGLDDPAAESYRDHRLKPLAEHLADWKRAIAAKGFTPKHLELFTTRARRVVAIVAGATLQEIAPPKKSKHAAFPAFELALDKWTAKARFSDLTADRVQAALSELKAAGKSHSTINHHRTAVKAFAAWCSDNHRTRENQLRGVTGFNAKTDPRHDRRTVSLNELRRIIEAAEHGRTVMGMTGPARSLCYRLAVATGLRYGEIASVTPTSFDWKAPSVTVPAAYTKNSQPATQGLSDDLAHDLAAYVADMAPSEPIFPLQTDAGARLLRHDLEAAGVPYRDAGGLVFDFHSLRCQMATLADAAGVSPRVTQKLMRHSSLELTTRYMRPRAVDIEAAAGKLPSLRPEADQTEAAAMTGTDPGPILQRDTQGAPAEDSNLRKSNARNGVETRKQRTQSPLVVFPAADRTRVNGLPDLGDAGGLHRTLRLVKLEASRVPLQTAPGDDRS
jgi:integrase